MEDLNPSPLEDLIRVPVEKLPTWVPKLASRNCYCCTAEIIVASPVLELVAESVSDTKDVIRSDRYVAAVVEAVRVASQQEAIINTVFAASCVRHNVGSLQDRHRMLTRYGASPVVGVADR